MSGRAGKHELKTAAFSEVMASFEAHIRALNAECEQDPFALGMNHAAEAEARHSVEKSSRFVPTNRHDNPGEDE